MVRGVALLSLSVAVAGCGRLGYGARDNDGGGSVDVGPPVDGAGGDAGALDGGPGNLCIRYVLEGATGDGLSPESPMGSIQEAIASAEAAGATGMVCVGAPNTDMCIATYPEAVVMSEGISVIGGFRVAADAFRPDPTCSTKIVAQGVDGVVFPAGVTEATRLEHMLMNARMGEEISSVVTMHGGGTITACELFTGAASLTTGVRVVDDPGMAELPRVSLRAVTIQGMGRPDGTAIAVQVVGRSVDIAECDLRGIDAEASVGVLLERATGSTIAASRIAAGAGATSIGVRVVGGSDLQLENNVVIGGSVTAMRSIGISLESCDPGPPIQIAGNDQIAGGGGAMGAIGIASTGCPANVAGNGRIVGAVDRALPLAFGVQCLAGASCTIEDNDEIDGILATAVATTAVGIHLGPGSRGAVRGNAEVRGCPEPTGATSEICLGVWVDGADGTTAIERNAIYASSGSSGATGIAVNEAHVAITNNVVVAATGQGVSIALRETGVAETVVHSNTVITPTGTGAGVALLDIDGAAALGSGVFRNNNLVCSDPATGNVAFRRSLTVRPRLFERNNLFGCDSLYQAGADRYSMLDMLNTEPGSSGNVTLAPDFIAEGDPHLDGSSPLIDRGTADGAPADDFDHEMRPLGIGPDIGADEAR